MILDAVLQTMIEAVRRGRRVKGHGRRHHGLFGAPVACPDHAAAGCGRPQDAGGGAAPADGLRAPSVDVQIASG
jgi:hypothetical protein